jgi:hypothetical protein
MVALLKALIGGAELTREKSIGRRNRAEFDALVLWQIRRAALPLNALTVGAIV